MRSVRLRPTVEFARAIKRSEISQTKLAALTGYPAACVISDICRRQRIRYTPLARARAQKLAETIGYDGPLFKDAVK